MSLEHCVVSLCLVTHSQISIKVDVKVFPYISYCALRFLVISLGHSLLRIVRVVIISIWILFV